MLTHLIYLIMAVTISLLSNLCQAQEEQEMETLPQGHLERLQTEPPLDQGSIQERPIRAPETENDSLYLSLYDLLQPMLTTLTKEAAEKEDLEEQITRACCIKFCGIKCFSEFHILSRVFWTFTQAGTSTLASLSNYGRRSLIPLAAFGGFDAEVKDNLLLWIAILQTIGETCETIQDYAITKAIRHQKNLRDLEKRYDQEIERKQTKALAKCVKNTTPKLHINALTPIKLEDINALKQLYHPRSERITSLEKEMQQLTDLTLCEKIYYTASDLFWHNTYPFFWFAEVALSLAQLVIVIADLSSEEAASLTLSILLVATEAAQYFCNSMKYYSEQKTYENYKFRKKIQDIGRGIDAGSESD
ncbi:hypothetical protein [Candidatus Odyssella thessalonicensis]|uniref:hypothetical protein n=1 Tax=Candidatus Odyssella thessalonicensis TaxID=84647 RepID=UPI0002F7874A|nr:hypothetical protein [Candidatus Odyssella thessalonicensis]